MRRSYEMMTLGVGMIFLLAGMVFPGCSSKEDQALYDKIQENSGRLIALQQSEKLIFNQGKENETILIISYLLWKSKKEERFIISGTPIGNSDNEVAIIEKSTIEGKHPLKIRRISQRELSDSLRGSIPSWYSIYRVSYPACKKKKFSFTLSIDGVVKTLYFYKGLKYLINKKEFRTF